MRKYAAHLRDLTLLVLDLICEGLGWVISIVNGVKYKFKSMNHYPACPHPSLSLELPKHGDPNLITVLNQGSVSGLEICQDEES